jgi:predicted DNA binding CopG/RHH family protein
MIVTTPSSSKDAKAVITPSSKRNDKGGTRSNNKENINSNKNNNNNSAGRQPEQQKKEEEKRQQQQQTSIASKNRPLLLRIPSNLLESLKDEAAKDDVSVNSLIITVLRKYTSWGRFQERLGFMPLHKSMILTMLDKLTSEEIEEIGRMQKDQTIRDFLLFESGYNLKSFMKWIELRCKVLGFELVVKQETNPTPSVFVMIHHNMGENWSLYYKGMFSAVLQELLPQDGKSYDQIIFKTTKASFAMHLVGVNMDIREATSGD